MELLVRRGQDDSKGLFSSKKVFTLYVRAQLTDEESANVKKYDMGFTMLYNDPEAAAGDEVKIDGYKYPVISVDSLAEGVNIQCKSVVLMMEVEQKILKACNFFKQMLDTAATFGGEQVYQFE